MVSKTVGSGGDFATLYDACVYLNSIAPWGGTPLTDDYKFTTIGDITESNSFADSVLFGGHTVTWTSLVKSNGDPTVGYKINNRGQYRILQNPGAGSTEVFDGLYFVGNGSSSGYITSQAYTQIAKNCLIIGNGGINSVGIGLGSIESRKCEIYNCKIYKCGSYGIGHQGGSGGGDIAEHLVENCTIFDCGINADPSYLAGIGNFLTAGWIIKNTVSCHTASHVGGRSDWGSSIGTVSYCADSDGTLTTGSNTQSNIVPANEFKSLISTNATFLFLKDTTAGSTFGAVFSGTPLSGIEPLRVTFTDASTDDVSYVYGADALGDSGTAPTLSSTDIAGVTMPDANGKYPIGCHAASVV